jgi:hypothetical protein
MKEFNRIIMKTAANILLDQLKDFHNAFRGTMEGVTEEVAHFQPEGTANPIAGTYAHLVFSEDFFIHMLIQGKAPLMETEFKDKTGASEIQPSEWENAYPKWLREVKVDLNKFKKYQEAVFSASEQYVASIEDKDLEKEIDMNAFGMGGKKLSSVLAGMVNGHVTSIMGEIAVLKGIQGLKGYPF